MSERSLPNGWRWVRLGEVCEKTTGNRDPSKAPDDYFFYIDISAVDNKTKRIVQPQHLMGKVAPSRARQIVRSGDVIVSTTRPNLNAVAKIPSSLDDSICSTGFCVLRPLNIIDGEYLFAYVQSDEFVQDLSQLVQGALYPAVTDQQVKNQPIPLPPIDEQRRIAGILSEQMAAVEQARASLTAQLESAEALQSAFLREVFEGEAAQSWPRVRLGEVCEFVIGRTPRRDTSSYWGGDLPWVSISDMKGESIFETKEHITQIGAQESRSRLIPAGTLLFSFKLTIGKMAFAGVDLYTNEAIAALIPKSGKVSNQYLRYALKSIDLTETAARAVKGNTLNQDTLYMLSIYLPSIQEQQRIVGLLSEQMATVQQVCTGLQQQLDALEALPGTLLDRAFRGEL